MNTRRLLITAAAVTFMTGATTTIALAQDDQDETTRALNEEQLDQAQEADDAMPVDDRYYGQGGPEYRSSEEADENAYDDDYDYNDYADEYDEDTDDNDED